MRNGVSGIFQLLDLGADPGTLGGIIGANELVGADDIGIPSLLESSDLLQRRFILSFISGQYSASHWAFVEGLQINRWNDAQIAGFASALPFRESTWQWLEKFNGVTRKEYWRRVPSFLRHPSLQELQTAVNSLTNVGRWYSAIRLLHFALLDDVAAPSEYIAFVLESNSETNDEMEKPDSSGQFTYAAQELVKHLQNDKNFDRARLAHIEWRFLALLDPQFGMVKPVALIAALESEPRSVVELLKAVYRGSHEVPRSEPMSEQDELRAQNANRLLEGLCRLPGTREDKSLNCDALREWMKDVQRLSSENDRRDVGDLFLGQLIGRSSPRLDE